jgi:voltage-gated potassium channel
VNHRDLFLLLHNRVSLALLGLTLVVLIGTVGYVFIEGWSLLDSLYMSVITITTVGYREVEPLSAAGQIFTMGLLFVGVGSAFYVLTAMVAAIIEGDFGLAFGARRMRAAIDRMSNHCIVCGFGRVGEEIARELGERKADLVVIDWGAPAVERARTTGLLVEDGDATAERVLLAAGLERCRALIACTDSDATNTFITLAAKGLRPDVMVVARISSPSVETKVRQAGANRVISPYTIGGRRMAYAALQPIIEDFIDVAPGDVLGDRILAEVAADESSGLVGKALTEVLGSCRDAVVLAVRHANGEMKVGPASSTVLMLGDRMMVVGGEDDLRSIGASPR